MLNLKQNQNSWESSSWDNMIVEVEWQPWMVGLFKAEKINHIYLFLRDDLHSIANQT